ncbi:hypothetical protein F4212_06530 [Candidatus Poribacteria bacterium]|nr:hypothetical protein [Candidatus Poribacteria bacterium]
MKLPATFSESLNVIVLDSDRFHHAKILEIPDNFILLFLPPYSPELNPIERLWQDLRQSCFAKYTKPLKVCRT